MRREDISPELYDKIIEFFTKELMKNGLKATTMDSVANGLQMSKRTLYEIFGNKEEMFLEAHKYFHKKMADKLSEIFNSSSNVMEGIIRCFLYNRDLISNLSPEFMHDIEEYSNHECFGNHLKSRKHHENLFEVLQKGVEQGYFRDDVNLMVQCRMFNIQLEALKRTEELFPEDISLLEVIDSIIIGFLRGISSTKGLEELEKYMPSFTNLSHVSYQ